MGQRKEKGRLSPAAGQEKQWQWQGVPDEHFSLGNFSGAAGESNEDDKVDGFFCHASPLTLYTEDHVKIPTGCFDS